METRQAIKFSPPLATETAENARAWLRANRIDAKLPAAGRKLLVVLPGAAGVIEVTRIGTDEPKRYAFALSNGQPQ